MPLLVWLSFLMHVDPIKIVLPTEIESIVLRDDAQGIYLLDNPNNTLYRLDPQGKILAQTPGTGNGPGFFVKSQDVTTFEDKVYVTDSNKQRVTIFNKNLEFLAEKAVHGSCRKIRVSKAGVFITLYDAVKHTMIKKYDLDLEQELASFGLPLEPEDVLMGVQVGTIEIIKDRIYFMHFLTPKIEAFDFNGKLLETVSIPGYPRSVLEDIDLNDRNFHNSIKHMLFLKIIANQLVAIEVPSETEELPRRFGYDPNTKKWEAPQVGPVGYTVGSSEYLSEEGTDGLILVKRKKS